MNNRFDRLAFVMAGLLLGAAPAGAYFAAGYRQTTGNENYRGEYGYFDVGGDLHLKPSVSGYHDDLSSGTYRTIAARLAYDQSRWGVGVTGGGTPVVNGYSNRFIGADATLSVFEVAPGTARRSRAPDADKDASQDGGKDSDDDAPKERGWGLERLDLGAGVTRTIHGTHFKDGLLPDSSDVLVEQMDYRGTIRVKLLRNMFTFDMTETRYDHSLLAADNQAQVQNLDGLDANIQGFPHETESGRIDFSMIPVLVPFASYTHTTFELAQPALNAYQVGAYLDIKFLELSASYQRLIQPGEPTLNLSSLGAGVRFY